MKTRYRWDKEQHKLVEVGKYVPEGRIHIIPDLDPYLDENLDSNPILVKSRRHRSDLLKERGLAIL